MSDKFRKKPIVIEAVQLRWSTWNEMVDFLGKGALTDIPGGTHAEMSDEYSDTCGETGPFCKMWLFTAHGDLTAFRHGDWVIPDSKPGTWYPCKPDVFAATYERVTDDA
jgi:hypothetical protein